MSTIKKILCYILIGFVLILGTWFCAGAYYKNQDQQVSGQSLSDTKNYDELETKFQKANSHIQALNNKVNEVMLEIDALRSQNRRLSNDYTLLNEKYDDAVKVNQYLKEKLKEYEK